MGLINYLISSEKIGFLPFGLLLHSVTKLATVILPQIDMLAELASTYP